MVKVAIFASGSGTNFENIVKANVAGMQVVLLIVDKECRAIDRANQLNVPYVYVNPKAFASKETYETKIQEYLLNYEIDLIVLAGYMRFIGKVLLTNYPNKIINIHPAYLPHFPGAHAIKDAFDAKVSETGVSIHYVDEGVDTGAIIHQEKIAIDPNWDLATLEKHVHALEYKMYPEVLERLCKEGNL